MPMHLIDFTELVAGRNLVSFKSPTDMPHFRMFKLFAFIFFLFGTFAPQIEGSIRYTNLRCSAPDKSWIVVNLCRLRAKSRDVVTLNVDFDILRVARTVFINMAVMKKANGYKPFLYNISVDGCEYLKRRNNPVLNLMYDAVRKYTTLNHSCPYTGNQKLLDFNLNTSLVPVPLPSGEYAIYFKCYFSENKVPFKETTEVAELRSYIEFIE